MKKKFVCVAGLALVLIAAAIFWMARSTRPEKALASVSLGDGRILQVEAVTYGTNHHVGIEDSDNILWRLTGWLPASLHQLFASRIPVSTINGLEVPSLVVWANAVNAVGGTNVDCQGIGAELINKHGEHFGTAASSWMGGQRFHRVGFVFKVYPRDETNLTLRVTTWKINQSSLMEIPNPHVIRPAEWTGSDLPQQTNAGDLNIALARLRLYTGTHPPYWQPVWELRRGTNTVNGWSPPGWQAEDPLGNHGQLLGTNQTSLRFSVTFYPDATNTADAQLLATLPQSPVTNKETVVWWNQTVRHGTNDILVLGLFPPGTRVFERGQLLTNPPTSRPLSMGPTRSEWTTTTRSVNPTKMVRYNSHYSISNSVIYVSAPHFPGPARLAMRLRDEQGRIWVAGLESMDGVYAFLIKLPPDVIQVTPELVLLTPVSATFTVKTPAIGAAEVGR